jgi:sigma-E factor negative regulatory protein RseB
VAGSKLAAKGPLLPPAGISGPSNGAAATWPAAGAGAADSGAAGTGTAGTGTVGTGTAGSGITGSGFTAAGPSGAVRPVTGRSGTGRSGTGRSGTGLRSSGLPTAGLPSEPISVTPAMQGEQLLNEAAFACRQVAFQGVEVLDWRGLAGAAAAVVDVWHARGGQTLTRDAASEPGRPGRIHHIDPPGDIEGAPVLVGDGMLGMDERLVGLLSANFRLVPEGTGLVAGRPAQVVAVRRSDGSLAARFWLDQATRLPLRRQVFGPGGQLAGDVGFTEVKVGAVPAVPVAAARPWGGVLAPAQLAALRDGGWPVPDPLPGHLSLLGARVRTAADGPVMDLDYSDGLSVISVFVERGHLPQALSGWSPVTLDGHRVYADVFDAHTVAWSAAGYVYTVVAAAPPQTVGQVVAALPHDARPGLLTRVGHGLRRLMSWLTP